MEQRHPCAVCSLCGEELRDGDTVYRLGNRLYCPACIMTGQEVLHPADESDPGFPPPIRFIRTENRGGIPHHICTNQNRKDSTL